MNMDLDFEILKYFESKKLKSEPSEFKRILLWSKSLKKRDFLKKIEYKIQLFTNYYQVLGSRSILKDELKFPVSFDKLGCPQHRCIITNDR